MLKVGNYVPPSGGQEAVIERGWYGQGWVFKDEDAFLNHPDKVCYIAELSDTCYTRNDLLEMCFGQEKLAEEIFYMCDWASPETVLEETLDEIDDDYLGCGF